MTDDETDERKLTDEEFRQGIETLSRAEKAVSELTEAIGGLDTGLTRSDTVALLYGRRNGLNKGTIEEAFATLDDVERKDPRELVIRLLAHYSDLNLGQAQGFVSELDTLRNRYPPEP